MQSLRATGDLAIANPDISAYVVAPITPPSSLTPLARHSNVDPDGDQIMATAQRTQFTQSLLLFVGIIVAV